MILAKSLSGEKVARQIISCISTEMGISFDLVIGAMHDRASIYQVAMKIAKVIIPIYSRCWLFSPHFR